MARIAARAISARGECEKLLKRESSCYASSAFCHHEAITKTGSFVAFRRSLAALGHATLVRSLTERWPTYAKDYRGWDDFTAANSSDGRRFGARGLLPEIGLQGRLRKDGARNCKDPGENEAGLPRIGGSEDGSETACVAQAAVEVLPLARTIMNSPGQGAVNRRSSSCQHSRHAFCSSVQESGKRVGCSRYRDSNMNAIVRPSFCGSSFAVLARSKVARSGPCADVQLWRLAPPGTNPPPLFASYSPCTRPMYSDITFR